MYEAAVELLLLLGDELLELDVSLAAVLLLELLLSLKPPDDDDDFELELEVNEARVELELNPRELTLVELALESDDFELLLDELRLDAELTDVPECPSDDEDEVRERAVEDDELLTLELEKRSTNDSELDGISWVPQVHNSNPAPCLGRDSFIDQLEALPTLPYLVPRHPNG